MVEVASGKVVIELEDGGKCDAAPRLELESEIAPCAKNLKRKALLQFEVELEVAPCFNLRVCSLPATCNCPCDLFFACITLVVVHETMKEKNSGSLLLTLAPIQFAACGCVKSKLL